MQKRKRKSEIIISKLGCDILLLILSDHQHVQQQSDRDSLY